MRFASIRLKNYAGIYDGMLLHEIFIDFTKCKHKLIIIRGDNGSGKSTLFKALNPLPDPNDSFLPGVQAEKEIDIVDNNNVIYNIKFIHAVKSNGDRDTTKGYIKKFTDHWVDLNPNGNISSFKDILYDEFKLDANFVALSQLSTDDRGLADKKPAERKKFINSIIDTLEAYNNIHKILSKKSSVCKSMMNSLTAKLSSLGDDKHLKSTLISLENRIVNLTKDKEKCTEELATHKSIITLVDPDGSIQDKYSVLDVELADHAIDIELLQKAIQASTIALELEDIRGNKKKIEDIYNTTSEKIIGIKTEIHVMENKIELLLSDREQESKSLNQKIQKLESLQSDLSYEQLTVAIKDTKDRISECEAMFNKIGVSDALKLSKDEYIIGLNTLKEIKEIIDVFRSHTEYSILQDTLTKYIANDTMPDIRIVQETIDEINDEIFMLLNKHKEYEMLQNIASKLTMRPKECKIGTCEFIKDAILASEKNPDEELKAISERLKQLHIELDNCEKVNATEEKTIECINYIRTIIRTIDRNSSILDKLPNGSMFTNKDEFFRRLLNHDSFEDINILYSYIDCANLFEDYKIYQETLYKLESDYKLYESKNDIIQEIITDIDELNRKLDDIALKLNSNERDMFTLQTELAKLIDYHSKLKDLINYNESLDELNDRCHYLNQEKAKLQSGMDRITTANEAIQNTNNKLAMINNELAPIIEDRDKIKHAIVLVEDYTAELMEYKSKYDKIETIKFYSSPTTGIQLVFMDLYMSKIINMANELLQLLFNGSFVLGSFIINENEFRIPCRGENGFVHDDISSMSTAQVSMISMILSFALLFQSSSKYNILKLDEIDGALDHNNRMYFTQLLQMQMEMLKVDQTFIISHNMEINSLQADIIQLKTISNEPIEGNVIFRH